MNDRFSYHGCAVLPALGIGIGLAFVGIIASEARDVLAGAVMIAFVLIVFLYFNSRMGDNKRMVKEVREDFSANFFIDDPLGRRAERERADESAAYWAEVMEKRKIDPNYMPPRKNQS